MADSVEQTSISDDEYTARVNSFKAGMAVSGPCAKCNRTGRFDWISNAAETKGQAMNGPCRQCGGKGFLTKRDDERNAEYLADRAARTERQAAWLSSQGFVVTAATS